VLYQHVLLVSHSDTSLRALAVAVGGLQDCLELVHWYLFL
jgi:hypothetical protein